MDSDAAWDRLISEPVAVLATIGADGAPHLVPFTFAPLGDRRLVSAIDEKPKRTRNVQRIENLQRDPRVTILAHHYDSNWTRLWWVRASGEATVSEEEPPGAGSALAGRYPHYAGQRLEPWVIIDIHSLTGWSASDL